MEWLLKAVDEKNRTVVKVTDIPSVEKYNKSEIVENTPDNEYVKKHTLNKKHVEKHTFKNTFTKKNILGNKEVNVGKRLLFIVVILIVVLLIPVIYINVSSKETDLKEKDTKIFDGNINNLSAWVVYWDLSSDREIKSLNSKLKNVSYFAVDFDSNNKLVMPEKLIGYYNKTKIYHYNKYITIVNDREKSDGSYPLKDINLLKDLLGNPESRNSHIEDIINLAVKYGFDGIEIDYEQIKDDINLWDNYLLFINKLYEKAEKKV